RRDGRLKNADTIDLPPLLCGRAGGQYRRHTADQNQEIPPPHSITSSARAMSDGGIMIPSAFAVRALRVKSKRVAVSIGKSPGAAPRKIRAICSPLRRRNSVRLGP